MLGYYFFDFLKKTYNASTTEGTVWKIYLKYHDIFNKNNFTNSNFSFGI